MWELLLQFWATKCLAKAVGVYYSGGQTLITHIKLLLYRDNSQVKIPQIILHIVIMIIIKIIMIVFMFILISVTCIVRKVSKIPCN